MKFVKIELKGFLKSEFEPTQDFYEVFERHGLRAGRMVGGSKSGYWDKYPDNLVVFNGNVVIEKHGKIWYGDLDVTREEDKLQAVANELSRTLYILSEHDARFENENAGMKYWKKNAKAVIKPQKS
jgi:hypothetical protein